MAIPPLHADMVSADGQEWEACPECAGPFLAKAEICENCSYSRRTAEIQKSKDATFWYRVVPGVMAAAVLMCLAQTQLGSVEFLLLFGFLGLCCGATTIGAGIYDLGKPRTFMVCLIAFELVGFVRILYGTSNGRDNFGFVQMMMVGCPVGASLLFAIFNDGEDPDWFSFSSGGGCGGGSGCGGCGGGCGGGGD